VHRVLAALVAVAMLSTSWSAPTQHVHAYVDHDHADHHHGPASHGHSTAAHPHAPDFHAPHDAAQLERCDPGQHAVSLAYTCVAPHPDHVPAPVRLETTIVVPPERAWRHVTPFDVRAHSPPRLTDAPLRAPPLVYLA
jgi:hypothetical protein